MKRVALTSFLALIMVCPAFADIAKDATSANCDNTTLNTTDGTSILSAQWTANTINLKWYNGETEITPSNDTAKTCTYDSGIVLPLNEPTREGYIFSGWKVKPLGFDLTTLSNKISENGSGGRGWSLLVDSAGSNEDIYGLTQGAGEWAIEFTYGTVKGEAVCATNSGKYAKTGDPVGSEGNFCWCRAKSFDDEKDGTYEAISAPAWTYYNRYVDKGTCASKCPGSCTTNIQTNAEFRSAVFGIANE